MEGCDVSEQGISDKGDRVKTGWERERRTHFDDVVVTYEHIRPQYPAALFADIFAYIGEGGGKRAIEIGAGTGKATAPFIDAGYAVSAVELGANMSEFLTERYKGREGFRVITASFEDAEFDDGDYDLIYAATAFHWVDAEVGCPKAVRLLKSGGVFALFRYSVVINDGDELDDEIQEAYKRHYYTYYTDKPNNKPVRKTPDEYRRPDEIHKGFRFYDMAAYGFGDVTMTFHYAAQTYTADEYMYLLDTFSDHRALPDSNREALRDDIKNAILRHGGAITIDYVFQLYMGRKP
jgi:SAM-dependent methyltransferase